MTAAIRMALRHKWTGLLMVAAATTWCIGIANCWFAMSDPIELEVREGSTWLYVLAQDAGYSLYNYQHVAFLNMNHGPLGPILAWVIHRTIPVLPPAMVTRAFVALLPMGLAGLFWIGTRRPWTALAWAGCTYLFILALAPAGFLVGRSDPAALFCLCLLLIAGDRMHLHGHDGARQTGVGGLVMGAVAAIVVLLNWRYAPAAMGAILVMGWEHTIDAPAGFRRRQAIAYLAGATVGGGLVASTIFTVIFHGDMALYYRHFFGVFTGASGWGTQGRMPYELIPSELTSGRMLVHWALLIGGILAVIQTARSTSRAAVKTGVWLLFLIALWASTTWGFFYNHGAGGLYYFAPFYVLAIYYLATRVHWAEARLTAGVAGVLALAGMPWQLTVHQAKELAETAHRARQFAQQCNDLTGGAPVYSEDLRFHKHAYHGEIIDMGDLVARVATTDFFPVAFRTAVQRQYAELDRDPPTFVLVGSEACITPHLRVLLKHRYEMVAQSAPLIYAQFGLPVRLYQRLPDR